MICAYVYMCRWIVLCVIFFFKQKTAYEMRISDWSSDVCSSDLLRATICSARLPDSWTQRRPQKEQFHEDDRHLARGDEQARGALRGSRSLWAPAHRHDQPRSVRTTDRAQSALEDRKSVV